MRYYPYKRVKKGTEFKKATNIQNSKGLFWFKKCVFKIWLTPSWDGSI